jgi:hypothetical protein
MNGYRFIKRRKQIIDIQWKTGNVIKVSVSKDNVSKVAPNVIGCGHCETTSVYRNTVVDHEAGKMLPGRG